MIQGGKKLCLVTELDNHLGQTEREYLKSTIEITVCFLMEIYFTIFDEKGVPL